ncbi:MAG TPA: S-layer homology domain-containing protein, partial [Anaerolineales bacterium]|nr:S-layer homology domain-containing protein [Anaerolineales bacterium]
GNTIVVGAYLEDSNAGGVNGNQLDNSATDSGAAYVFTLSGGVWSQQAYLKASNTGSNDYFGFPVAISGDTIVVAAANEDSDAIGVNGNQGNNNEGESGAVYVFTRSNNNWSQQAYLKASNGDAIDLFGKSIAISGDTIVVGAPYEDSNATGVNGNQLDNSASNSGAAYVFTRSNGVWNQQAYLKSSNTDGSDLFGTSIDISGDTIAVGVPYEDSDATGVNGDQLDNSADAAGAVYIYIRNGNTWSPQAYLKASNTEAGDSFGYALSISGDMLAVGAIKEDSNAGGVNGNEANNSASDSGAAYIFTRNGSNWSQQAYIKASNTEPADSFGYQIKVDGNTLIAGAFNEDSIATGVNGNQGDNSAMEAGALYAFLIPSHTVIFNANGGVGSMSDQVANAPTTLTNNTFTRTGFTFTGWNTAPDGSGTAYTDGATYNFTADLTLYAQWSISSPIFADVPMDYWAWQFIERLYNAGITGGCGTNPLIYCPENSVTRAQMAVFLEKGLHGSNFNPANMPPTFSDTAGHWAEDWIEALKSDSITSGCASGLYCPENSVTRAQMAVFLLKSTHGASYSPPPATGTFSDVPTDHWAAAWIEQLAAEGITSGCGSGIYCPENPVTRAQMAVFLVKAFNLP